MQKPSRLAFAATRAYLARMYGPSRNPARAARIYNRFESHIAAVREYERQAAALARAEVLMRPHRSMEAARDYLNLMLGRKS